MTHFIRPHPLLPKVEMYDDIQAWADALVENLELGEVDVDVFTATAIVVTAAVVMGVEDRMLLVDSNAAAFSVTLPPVSEAVGHMYRIKRTNTSLNQITVITPGAETLDGKADFLLDKQWDSVTVVSDGSNWFIL